MIARADIDINIKPFSRPNLPLLRSPQLWATGASMNGFLVTDLDEQFRYSHHLYKVHITSLFSQYKLC
ncbi:hypothetical protein P691DRAFT_75164 [Macrolepiota fuliginosa MF-IS2]|uniref:Uncharacterized protein n=1 Tax=Macrolepiota fuliginosa MF-IS2 TaxID=1400762 RepID=A0A9P6BWR6_9AGAR|nr:hypothetical protein P691DRAFT_75164 [Macrolepiota fuliginosa MF-IS2]